MISSNLSATWPSLVPAFGNHLWQSSVFVIAAGLLTLVLRQNHARFRYWLWLVASVKFLIPFSLLVALGSYLSGAHTVAGTNAAFYIAVEEVRDRKSTRLNSSHGYISYAGLCLKKKKYRRTASSARRRRFRSAGTCSAARRSRPGRSSPEG